MLSKLSYVSRPMDRPYLYTTFAERLHQLAEANPTQEAFVFYDFHGSRSSLTRKQLLEQSVEVGKRFVQLGVKKGTPVAMSMYNSFDTLLLQIGLMLAGGVPVYLSTTLKDGSDLIDMLNAMKVEILIMDVFSKDGEAIIEKLCQFLYESCPIASLKYILYSGNIQEHHAGRITTMPIKEFLVSPAPEDVMFPDIQPEDALAHFCFSGSTGKPKTITYTHFMILNWTALTNAEFGIKDESVWFCDRTFSWVVGYPRTYLTEGTTRVFLDMRITVSGKEVKRVFDIIEAERCDVVYLPGYLLRDVCSRPDLSDKFRYVKNIVLSGERISRSAVTELHKIAPTASLHCYYGTTETGGTASYTMTDPSQWEDGIIGSPFRGVEMKLVDDNGCVVPKGESGELLIRCAWRFKGYKTKGLVVDDLNWFHTGDAAFLRGDDQLVINGRKQELISIGTSKFLPWPIEEVLRKCPGVENAFAVGVPDPRLKQVVCACVVSKSGVQLTTDALVKYCDDTFLDEDPALVVSNKPTYHVVLEKVPLLASGKIVRQEISRTVIGKLGL